MSIRSLHWLRRITCLALLTLAQGVFALAITRDFSASWYNPATNGQGFSIEIIDAPGGKTMVTYWYTFDADGRQIWVVASGPVRGDRATLAAFTATGGRFGNLFDPSQVNSVAWGSLQVEFSSCDQGTVSYSPVDPRLPAGSMPIRRLSSLFNSRCTGGITDDAEDSGDTKITQPLVPLTGLGRPIGNAHFAETLGYSEFSTSVQNLEPGTYSVEVGGEERGEMTVFATSAGNRGELEFRSPPEPGRLALEFDPRGQRVSIRRAGTEVMMVDFPTEEPPETVVPGAPPFGNAIYAVDFVPPPDQPGHGGADLELREACVQLHVYAAGLPAGTYAVRIGGDVRAEVEVVPNVEDNFGEIYFRSPQEDGKFALDFDPRGLRFEILLDDVVVLSGVLPTVPTFVGDDQPGNG